MEHPVFPGPVVAQPTRPRGRPWLVAGIVGCLLAATLGFGLYRGFWPVSAGNDVEIGADPDAPVPAVAILLPPTVPAAHADIAENEPIIGVAIGGHHRAYCVSALSGNPVLHVVDDRIGTSPVCVTYCPIGQCTRVFADDKGPLLEVTLGGLAPNHRHLLLRVGKHRYDQKTLQPLSASAPRFPYDAYPYCVTTWKKWREAHPDTDAYLGQT